MASSHIARINAGGSDHRIAHSLYGYCTTAAATAAKTVSLYTGSSTTTDGTWAAVDLFHGLTIKVRFQYSNTVANPTLNVNETGAKPIYQYGTTAAAKTAITSWQAQEIVSFTYDTLLNSTGCWVIDRGYRLGNDNTYDRTYLSNNAIKAGDTAIVAANICTATTAGLYQHLKSGAAFDITYPIVYASSAITANSTSNGTYIMIPFNISTTQGMTLTPHKAIYIKGTLNGTVFTPVSSAPLTQTIPTSADNYQYMLLGYARATSPNAYLLYEHPIYEYSGGKFSLYSGKFYQYEGIIYCANFTSDQNIIDDIILNKKDGMYYITNAPSGTFPESEGLLSLEGTNRDLVLLRFTGEISGKTWIRIYSSLGNDWYDSWKYIITLESPQSPKIYTGTCDTAAATAQKNVTLLDDTGFSLTTGVRVSVRFKYGNSSTTVPYLKVGSTDAKIIGIPTSATSVSNSVVPFNIWGPYLTITFTYNGSCWVRLPSSLQIYQTHQKVFMSYQYRETIDCSSFTSDQNIIDDILYMDANDGTYYITNAPTGTFPESFGLLSLDGTNTNVILLRFTGETSGKTWIRAYGISTDSWYNNWNCISNELRTFSNQQFTLADLKALEAGTYYFTGCTSTELPNGTGVMIVFRTGEARVFMFFPLSGTPASNGIIFIRIMVSDADLVLNTWRAIS